MPGLKRFIPNRLSREKNKEPCPPIVEEEKLVLKRANARLHKRNKSSLNILSGLGIVHNSLPIRDDVRFSRQNSFEPGQSLKDFDISPVDGSIEPAKEGPGLRPLQLPALVASQDESPKSPVDSSRPESQEEDAKASNAIPIAGRKSLGVEPLDNLAVDAAWSALRRRAKSRLNLSADAESTLRVVNGDPEPELESPVESAGNAHVPQESNRDEKAKVPAIRDLDWAAISEEEARQIAKAYDAATALSGEGSSPADSAIALSRRGSSRRYSGKGKGRLDRNSSSSRKVSAALDVWLDSQLSFSDELQHKLDCPIPDCAAIKVAFSRQFFVEEHLRRFHRIDLEKDNGSKCAKLHHETQQEQFSSWLKANDYSDIDLFSGTSIESYDNEATAASRPQPRNERPTGSRSEVLDGPDQQDVVAQAISDTVDQDQPSLHANAWVIESLRILELSKLRQKRDKEFQSKAGTQKDQLEEDILRAVTDEDWLREAQFKSEIGEERLREERKELDRRVDELLEQAIREIEEEQRIQKEHRLERERAQQKLEQVICEIEEENRIEEEQRLKREARERARQKECCVCGDSKDPLDFHTASPSIGCAHPPNTCKECLQSWMASEFDTKGCDGIKCPECAQTLEYNEVQQAASAETFEAYDKLAFRNALGSLDEFAWCLAVGCGSGQLNIENNHFMDCVSCGYKQCLNHKVAWHEGETCEQYDYRTSGQKKRDEEKKEEEMLNTLSKKCPGPGCGWRIQKIDGCEHMTCKKCKFEFCWQCLASHVEIKRVGNTAHAATCKFHSTNLDVTWPFNMH